MRAGSATRTAAKPAATALSMPGVEKYRADWDPAALEKLKAELRQMGKKDGHYVEAFRRATGFNEE